MGTWQGHSNGEFTLNSDHFAAVQDVLANKQTPVSLDYEHASIRPTGLPTPAAGWVLSTEVRPDGLWALVELTGNAANMVKAGEYRYCSGVFLFDAVDPQTGEPLYCVLDSIALTNRPFVDGQEPIMLTRQVALTAGAPKMELDLKTLQKALDALPGPNTPEKIKMVIDLLAKQDEPAPGAAAATDTPAGAPKAEMSRPVPSTKGRPVARKAVLAAPTDTAPTAPLAGEMPPSAPVAPPVAPAVSMAPDVTAPPPDSDDDSAMDALQEKLMEATGLDLVTLVQKLTDNWDAVVALLTGDTSMAASAALSRDLTVSALTTSLREMGKELNKLQTAEVARNHATMDVEVDALVTTGRLHPSKKAEMVALARKSPVEFRAVAGLLVPHLPVNAHAVALTAGGPGSEHLAGSGSPLPADHPLVKQTTLMLDRMKITGKAREDALASLKA